MLSFDVTAASKGELSELLQTLTQRARFLTVRRGPRARRGHRAALRFRHSRCHGRAGRADRNRRRGCIAVRRPVRARRPVSLRISPR